MYKSETFPIIVEEPMTVKEEEFPLRSAVRVPESISWEAPLMEIVFVCIEQCIQYTVLLSIVRAATDIAEFINTTAFSSKTLSSGAGTPNGVQHSEQFHGSKGRGEKVA